MISPLGTYISLNNDIYIALLIQLTPQVQADRVTLRQTHRVGPIESLLCTNLDIEQVCLIGSGMKKPAALKVLTAMDNKRDISVVNHLKNILSNVDAELENHQKTDYLFIYADTWSGENCLLTPSMKIKINIIEKKHYVITTKKLSDFVIYEADMF